MRALLRVVLAVGLFMIVTVGFSRAATAPSRSGYQLVRRVPSGSTGPYTFFTSSQPAVGGTLVNENTGIRLPVPHPPCGSWSPLVGGGNLLAECGGSVAAVYPLPQGPWRPVTLSALCENFAGPGMGACQITGVGRFWISLLGTSDHSTAERFDESLQTGALADLATAPNSAPDLSDPGLERTLCAPLIKPSNATVTFDGPYVLEQSRRGLLVRRCGRADPVTDLPDVTFVTARPHLLLWDADDIVEGLCLPSLQPISYAAPPYDQSVEVEQLTQHHVYLGADTVLGAHESYRTNWPDC